MERVIGQDYVHSTGSVDKSRVLDVKPLRRLTPIFPSSPQDPPFVCSPPYGPYPPGFTPFYPFNTPHSTQNTPLGNQRANPPRGGTSQNGGHSPGQTTPIPSGPTPIRSYRPSSASNGDAEMDEEGFVDRPKRAARMKSMGVEAGLGVGEELLVSLNLSQRDDGDKEVVDYVLIVFDSLRRRLSQLDSTKDTPAGASKSSTLKAANILMTKGFRTNLRKRIGNVPGVEVGDIFFFRMEMCLVGLHSQAMAGIDTMTLKDNSQEERIAVSIVSSAGYDDETEDSDILIYSGQGGKSNPSHTSVQVADQKLVRGNLALDISSRRANVVRVIRGLKDINPFSKVYVYDGLYTIKESWIEKGQSGCNVFKYKLIRQPGQPNAFAIWKSIQKWKEGFTSRAGVILPDLSSGAESIPVTLVNDVDNEKGPAYFTYIPSLKNAKAFSLTQATSGCNCRHACYPGDLNCSCMQKNGGKFPYTINDLLVSRRPLVHECGPTCPCFPKCKNRVSQTGLKVRLEVFKTKDMGWGLRSWDPIHAGTFICEYAGEVIESTKPCGENGENDDYMFDTTRLYDAFNWSHEPADTNEEYDIPFPLRISSKNAGNVARFMNHSCYPNVFWQPIVYDLDYEAFLHIAFFAIKHIPPMTELTFDYGIPQSERNDAPGIDVLDRKKKCLCRSHNCRGYFD